MFRLSSSLQAFGLCLSMAFLSATAVAQPAKLKWTDNTEKTTIDAEFVRMAEGAVVLKKDGKEISVPLAKLSMASHLQALKLANPAAYSKAPPKAVVGIEQTAESTKLLNESPFKEDQTIEAFLDTMTAELMAGNATAAWHALTPEMQADVEDVVVAAVEAGGKGMLVQIRTLMKHTATIVHDKKAFIFASPLVAADPKVAKEMQQSWPQTELFVDALTDKSNWDSANFKAGNVGPWLAALTSKMGGAFVKMNELAVKAGTPGADLKKLMAYKVISQSGDKAMVQSLFVPPPVMNPQTRQMMQPKAPEPVEWVRVSGKWLPKDLVDNWKDGVAATKSQLDFVMPSVSGGLAFAIPFAGSLANAKTQQEFNAALQQITSAIPGMGGPGGANGMAGGMPGGMPAPGNFEGGMPAPGSGGPAGAPGKGGRAVITDP
ncbi:MAG: SHD1 domain-containing protein [Pirellulaceae bacterium]|nr:SHD1 domain-containing protein [Pirellulaceae bacterium]